MGGPQEFLLPISLPLLGKVWDGLAPTVKLYHLAISGVLSVKLVI